MSEVKKETKVKKKTTKAEEKPKKVVKKTTTKDKEKKVVKEEKTLLNKKDQSYYRSLCKVVEILAKIGKIFLMIFVPFIFLVMILIPIFFKNYTISANIIKFGDVNLIVNEDKLTIKVGDETHVLKCDANELDKITTFLTENSKGTIVTFIELSLLLFAIVLIINIYILYNLERLFTNFVTKKTPFIKENTKYVLHIALFLTALKFINICLSIVDLSPIKISSYSLFEILIVFIVYFIFKYAVSMQSKVDTTICD